MFFIFCIHSSQQCHLRSIKQARDEAAGSLDILPHKQNLCDSLKLCRVTCWAMETSLCYGWIVTACVDIAPCLWFDLAKFIVHFAFAEHYWMNEWMNERFISLKLVQTFMTFFYMLLELLYLLHGLFTLCWFMEFYMWDNPWNRWCS